MRRLHGLIALLIVVGTYLHYVQGWDFERVKRTAVGRVFWKEDASATTTPVGRRGTGTHWETGSPMPKPRGEFGAAELGGRIYVVGGIDGYGRTLDSVLVYDILTDTWGEAPRLPEARHHAAVAADGERLYVVGGFVGISFRPVDSAFAYDPAKREWSELGGLNDFRGAAAAAVAGGRLFVLGGVTPSGPSASVEWYDIARKGWNGLKTEMATPREHHGAAVLGGKLYAVGGRKGSPATNLAALEVLDPTDGAERWRSLKEMPTPRGGIGAAALGGKLYVFGGEAKGGTIGVVEAYDPKKDAWTALDLPMPSPRHGLAAVTYENRIYVLGGGRRPGFSVSDLNEILVVAP